MDVIREDLFVAIAAIEADNFELVNIIGNRISTDAMIIGKEDLVMLGLLVKEVHGELSAIKGLNPSKLKEGKQEAARFLRESQSALKGNQTVMDLWHMYHAYENSIRCYLVPAIESQIYKSRPEYTSKTRNFLVDYLRQNREQFLRGNYNLFDGIVTEMAKQINLYGFGIEDLAFYLTMKAFYNYYLYFRIDYQSSSGEYKDERERQALSFLDGVLEIFTGEKAKDEICVESAKIINGLVVQWRKYFLELGEIIFRVGERRSELPPELRGKIEQLLAEGLEREIAKGKHD